jgi:hypothetical protein
MNSAMGRNPQHRFIGYVVTSFLTVLAAANGMLLATLIGVALISLSEALHHFVGAATRDNPAVANGRAASLNNLADASAKASRELEDFNANHWESEAPPSRTSIARDKTTEGGPI